MENLHSESFTADFRAKHLCLQRISQLEPPSITPEGNWEDDSGPMGCYHVQGFRSNLNNAQH